MTIRFSTFPRTQTPPAFITKVIAVFQGHFGEISTTGSEMGIKTPKPEVDLIAGRLA